MRSNTGTTLLLPNTRTETVLGYAAVTASTLKDISQSSTTPFLRTISAVSLSIVSIAQHVKTNRDECVRMVSQIDELLAVILRLCIRSETEGGHPIPPGMLYNMGSFAEHVLICVVYTKHSHLFRSTLQKIHSFVEAQQNTSLIKGFFRQGENSALLEACRSGLSHALDVFGVQTSLQASTEMADIRSEATKRHHELVELFSEAKAMTESDSVSLLIKRPNNSSTSFLIIPANPQIFYGRGYELAALVSLLLKDPTRAAILGPGGIGKTTLCLAALPVHHPDVTTKYPARYFVSCESATTLDNFVAAIATALGVSLSGNSAKRIVKHLVGLGPCLLVLDNFESTWEPTSSRNQVEDFLSLLADISHVGLLLTMRGAERPGGVRWTRPFLPPLEPLSNEAAEQVFLNITDDEVYNDKQDLHELLSFTENVPLAVTLVANIAAFEGYETLLLRWKTEKTRLFSDGPDKRSNLDLSIRVSLSSPRMVNCPGAQPLLSLLSLLPDGISDTDLLQSNFPILEIGRSKTTLVRTSLAYIAHDQRLRVLAPIREYIQDHHSPPSSLCRPLRKHLHELIVLWKNYQHFSAVGITSRISANAGNLTAVLSRGLDPNEPDLRDTIDSILTFDLFLRISGRRWSGLLDRIPELLPYVSDREIHAQYLTEYIVTSDYHSVVDIGGLEEEAVAHYHAVNNKVGEGRLLCALGRYFHKHENDIEKSLRYYERGLAVSRTSDDAAGQCRALRDITQMLWHLGRYRDALVKSREIRRLAKLNGLFYQEANGIRQKLLCLVCLGDFPVCAGLSAYARDLLAMCGLQDGQLDLFLQDINADVHFQKSEYLESKEIYLRTYLIQPPLAQVYDKMNLVHIDIEMAQESTSTLRQRVLEVQNAFHTFQNTLGNAFCAIFLAFIDIQAGQKRSALLGLEKTFAETRSYDQELSILALNKLADPECGMTNSWTTFGWALVLLALALKGQNKPAIFHSLRCTGDFFRNSLGDADTALSLFEVALEGFAAMDVHRSRGECALRIGDISQRKGRRKEAEDMWRLARQCFLRCPLDKAVAGVDARLLDTNAITVGTKTVPVPIRADNTRVITNSSLSTSL
ncbi:NB-ARC domain-containing protein [Mycena indigotica]|uniref:NB-ARC domain-containing protein n=1 Tax=Mycena indigotica TaxID=2126181 RepID=A0A8H6TCH1_9AGAR|nr:NB-ARC domain-containing protein [Mycena indigotica]KAF7314916.1 NB-ARC domain-containing protein [Mycena indigotica]